jgi:hypothetical protein
MFSISIVREPPNGIYRKIECLRTNSFYRDPFDDDYWGGGIQVLMDEVALKKARMDDPCSYLCLLMQNDSDLVGYSRFSLNCFKLNSMDVSKLHVMLIAKEIRGVRIELKENNAVIVAKASNVLMNKIISFCAKQLSGILISEICVFPTVNIPSILLHRKYGFISCCDDLKNRNHRHVWSRWIGIRIWPGLTTVRNRVWTD